MSDSYSSTNESDEREIAYAQVLLGVSPTATKDDIKRAYRKKSRIHHPDFSGSAEMFHKLGEARDTLLKAHDRTPHGTGHHQRFTTSAGTYTETGWGETAAGESTTTPPEGDGGDTSSGSASTQQDTNDGKFSPVNQNTPSKGAWGELRSELRRVIANVAPYLLPATVALVVAAVFLPSAAAGPAQISLSGLLSSMFGSPPDPNIEPDASRVLSYPISMVIAVLGLVVVVAGGRFADMGIFRKSAAVALLAATWIGVLFGSVAALIPAIVLFVVWTVTSKD